MKKTILITGGTTGIGRAVVDLALTQDFQVIAIGKNIERISALQDDLGEEHIVAAVDIANPLELSQFFESLKRRGIKKIDQVVVNAGVSHQTPIDNVENNVIHEIVNVNFLGAYYSVKESVPFMKNGSSIVMVSAVGAFFGMSGFSIYSATKAAIITLAKSFAAELLDQDIRVNSIAPGMVDTPIFGKLGMNQSDIQSFAKTLPSKRAANPIEIAELILFLLSDKASYINAENIVIDAGVLGIYG